MSTDELPRIIGLTGGIASGKSTVSNIFRELGACVIDADEIARLVVAPGSEGLREIQSTFGDAFIRPDGELDRTRLGELVFSDDAARSKLNAITHPRIATAMLDAAMQAGQDGYSWVIYDAALLVENGLHKALPGLIVVAARPQIQLERLIARDKLTPDQAHARIDAQLPLDEKIAVADWVIDNNGSPENTRAQVESLFHILNEDRPA